jgi:hypothetical protein
VKTLRRNTAIVVAIVVIAGVSWFALKRIDCERRNAAFARKIKAIKQDAHEQLKIGTKKAEVARFFAEHSISFTTVIDRTVDLKNWVEVFKSLVSNTKVLKIFAFSNNHYAGHGPATAKLFMDLWNKKQ